MYQLFLIPLVVMFVNQIVKVLLEIFRGRFTWFSILSYGGMPSSHAATVTSLVYCMAYYQGLNSPAFALALVLALLIIRDATGIRWQIGKNSRLINQLIKELPDEREYHYPVLEERFGHKNSEVIVGILLGLVVTIILIQVWPK
ncbi:MAG: divergent PAP2 family protein [Patescibacteria group bacterium]